MLELRLQVAALVGETDVAAARQGLEAVVATPEAAVETVTEARRRLERLAAPR